MNILLGDFNAKVGRDYIFKLTIGNESLHEISNEIAVNKQRSHMFAVEMFNLKKLNKVEGKEKHHVGVSNRFAALEDCDAEVQINNALETIGENINISAKESLG
jgi:hypothetical protein